MTNEQTSQEEQRQRDAEDQLMDWGLRTRLGEEPAPDLTQIIAAAAELSTQSGPTTPTSEGNQKVTAGRYWLIGLAATLLLGLGGMFAAQQAWSPQQVANLPSPANSNPVSVSTTDDKPTVDESSSISLPADASDEAIEAIMMVTPGIVIQEDEEETALGIAAFSADSDNVELDDLFDAARWEAERKAWQSKEPVATSYGHPIKISNLWGAGLEVPSGTFGEVTRNSASGPASGPTALELDFEGRPVRGVVKPVTQSTMQSYTVTVPQQRSRTVNYTVMVPVTETRQEKRPVEKDGKTTMSLVDVPYTVMVPEQRTREETYTVAVPETRARQIKVIVNEHQFFDDNGDQLALSSEQRTKLEALVQQQIGQGRGPELGGDKYKRIHENPYVTAKGTDAVSTFSIDVDTASYSNVRQYLTESGQLPPPDAVRLEELVNYFDYDYAGPGKEEQHPFVAHTEVAGCPWNEDHRLVRVAIKGREVEADKRPLSNLVFLVDVSGSMNEPNKLPLVVEGLSYMTNELGENDRVSIVVYAGSEGLALPSTRGDNQDAILAALQQLSAGGSTAGGAGIKLAYEVAEKHFIKGGSNRVILCTDGDFNVGLTSEADLERLAEQKAAETGVFLTVLGFGRGNLNDAMIETISNRGNGTYHYVDNLREARRVLVQQLSGTLVTIAKDVKIQVEFNPANVSGYRLLGYENRMLARQDFNDDTKDAGEVGAGHTVTAIYEVVPAGVELASTSEEPLKYQEGDSALKDDQDSTSGKSLFKFTDELLTLRLRYKLPSADTSTKIEFSVKDKEQEFSEASADFRFAASVAGFGMLLRDSQYKGNATFASIRELASTALGKDVRGYRAEFLGLIEAARKLK